MAGNIGESNVWLKVMRDGIFIGRFFSDSTRGQKLSEIASHTKINDEDLWEGRSRSVNRVGAEESKDILADCLSNQKPEVQRVLLSFSSVFELSNQLPLPPDHDHAIELELGTQAMNVQPYRYPQFHKDEIEKLVKEMLLTEIIQPSKSVFSSPVLLVKKKDSSWRFYMDYWALNLTTKYPIPVVEELLDELFEATIFSKIYLKSGYHHIRVRAADVHKTALRAYEGHYKFVVMPFGLKNAPTTF